MPKETALQPDLLRVYTVDDLDRVARRLRGCALTIGNFDGVHRGHQAILADVREGASSPGVPAVAMTFEPHPVRYFHPEHKPFRLTTPVQKLHLLSHYGIDAPIIIRFGRDLSELEPETFIRRVVWDTFRPERVVVGYDFNFGKDRRGTPELAQTVLESLGATCELQRAVEVGGDVVSSTRIRRSVEQGQMKVARRLLGRPFAVLGTVTRGAGRGRSLGFPTANVEPTTERLPGTGVYATLLEVGSDLWRSITNIGVRPTFGANGVTVETFVLDERAPANLDFYGRHVAVHLIERIREERKFPSAQALVDQIQRDVEQCRMILSDERGDDVVRQAVAVSTRMNADEIRTADERG